MTNQEMRTAQKELDVGYFKINYKTGVHYGVIEDFFNGKTEELAPADRQRMVALFEAEAKRQKKR